MVLLEHNKKFKGAQKEMEFMYIKIKAGFKTWYTIRHFSF